MTAPAVEVNGLVKHFDGKTALDAVSFEVKPGELFGFIGPDGAGKSTLFRILVTLLLPDAGSASVLGHDVVSGLWELRRRIGYMPGRFALYPDLSVEENLRFFASVFGTTVEAEYGRIAPIYAQIEPFRKRRAGALSGGMKQKLALSCALVHRPDILFLDEPTTGVDPVSRREFWDLLGRLKTQGLTILVSTPYMDEAGRCDRVGFIQDGRILAIDRPDVIVRRFDQPRPARDSRPAEGVAIQATELSRRFGAFKAVDRISFDVRAGEVFGFLGANGAGKTTVIRMLTGLLLPSGGRATVAGHDVYTESEAIKRTIGYMSQRFSLYEDLTAEENIRLYGGIYGLAPDELRRRSDRMLERLGLGQAARQPVRAIPLGWRQKLAFSVALLHQPRVVFLDEPTSGVDPITRRQFWELIYEAARDGTTMLVTTHYMEEAEYCDRISIMVRGRIEALGTPVELKRRFGVDSIDELFVRLARPAGAAV